MFVHPLERLAAHMPYGKGLDLRNNSKYPGLEQWFLAMLDLPSYQKVRSDDRSIQLHFRYGPHPTTPSPLAHVAIPIDLKHHSADVLSIHGFAQQSF